MSADEVVRKVTEEELLPILKASVERARAARRAAQVAEIGELLRGDPWREDGSLR